MILNKLRKQVLKANLELVKNGLVSLTWGNVSGIDRQNGLIVIKPSGIDYEKMKVEDLVVIDLKGRKIEGELSPSSDTPTHIELYLQFKDIGGISHTHSIYATSFAQSRKEIPCFGTTHADNFYGSIPITRFLSKKELVSNYERNTGKIIVERFRNLDHSKIPAVLVAGHAPFTWGKNPWEAVKNSIVLENIAKMAYYSLKLNPALKALPAYILNKHHERKHGPNAYYGQKKSSNFSNREINK